MDRDFTGNTPSFDFPIIELERKLGQLRKSPLAKEPELAKEIRYLEKEIDKLRKKTYSNLTPWQKVQLARHAERPRFLDYLPLLFLDFIELHGDRLYADDPAIVGGLAYFEGSPLVVVGENKGKTIRQKLKTNFGMPHPEGYRKAGRLFKLAEKFSLPVLTFIDTPGAYPGIGAEERGQAHAISENIRLLSSLETPIIATNIGEGGSGGALAIGIADYFIMLENSYLSVITPEGCASILWGEASESKKEAAASALCLTAHELKKHKLIDEIIPEPLGGAQRDIDFVVEKLKNSLSAALKRLEKISKSKLLSRRFNKYKSIGEYQENRLLQLAEEIKVVRGKNSKR